MVVFAGVVEPLGKHGLREGLNQRDEFEVAEV